jgi:DNA-binding transcriptional LysR family regulator
MRGLLERTRFGGMEGKAGGAAPCPVEWAVEGRGVVMKSIWDIGADLQAGRLEVLLPEWRCPDAPVNALFQRTPYMAPRARTLLDFLEQRFAEASRSLEPFFVR